MRTTRQEKKEEEEKEEKEKTTTRGPSPLPILEVNDLVQGVR